jgi:predicted peroxiredoxin
LAGFREAETPQPSYGPRHQHSRQEEETLDANGNGKVVVNLATGLEDPERVTVAFLVAGAAATGGKEVTMFLTKEAVRLAMPGVAEGVACDGCPPLPTLAAQFAEAGGRLLVCPYCFNARKLAEDDLVDHAEIGGATPLWQWIGDGATVFSY